MLSSIREADHRIQLHSSFSISQEDKERLETELEEHKNKNTVPKSMKITVKVQVSTDKQGLMDEIITNATTIRGVDWMWFTAYTLGALGGVIGALAGGASAGRPWIRLTSAWAMKKSGKECTSI